MRNNNLKRVWLITRIWLVAVTINAVLGTFYLSEFKYDGYTTTIFFAGLLWGLPFSLPVSVIIWVVMDQCMQAEMNGLNLFRRVFITGILMSLIMFFIFCWIMGGLPGSYKIVLLSNAVLSGIIAIAAHYRPLLRQGKV